MKPSIQTLGQILYSPSQYVIPVFQRNYRWETPQWQKLWNSLVEIQRPDKSGNHFMGFLVVVPGLAQPGQHTTFHLIDGQQRLTTASILLTAIRNVARTAKQADLADEIHQDYLVHSRKKGDQHFRLLPKERDHDSYIALVSEKGRVSGRVGDAQAYFEERVSAHAAESPARLRDLFDTVRQKLEFMFATLESENAYNIFKSLNSTGVPLGPSDLIRNFVFMHVKPDDQDEFDSELWQPLEAHFGAANGALDEERFSRFFRDYLMSGGRYVSPKDTFQEFESRYEATGFAARELAGALRTAVGHYAIISGQQRDESDLVTNALAGLNALESSTTYPILLTLFSKRTNGAIDSPALAQCVEMLRGFILRRFVCGESSRGYGQMFVRALSGDQGDVRKCLEGYLLERGWPHDDQFVKALAEFPIYQRAYAREVLVTLERSRGHKEPADLKDAQIEHVMPQTLRDEWVADLGPEANRIHGEWLHRIGNLTLSAYNQELWNHPFSLKRGHYVDSNIVITRELSNSQLWREVQIKDRSKALALEASRIWVGPKEAVVQPVADADEDEEAPGRKELRLRFWTALNDYLVAEYPELPDLEARPSWAIRIPSGIRHIGFELVYNIRRQHVEIDIWFSRDASRALWERIKDSPAEYNSLIEAEWQFESAEGRQRAKMALIHEVERIRQEASWVPAFEWLGAKLSLVFERVAPKLRADMNSEGPD